MGNFDEKKWLIRQMNEQNWSKIVDYVMHKGLEIETQKFLFEEYKALSDSNDKDAIEKRGNINNVLCWLPWGVPMFQPVRQFRIEREKYWERNKTKEIQVSAEEELLFCRHFFEKAVDLRYYSCDSGLIIFGSFRNYAGYRGLLLQTQRFLKDCYDSVEAKAQEYFEVEEKRAHYIKLVQENIAEVFYQMIEKKNSNEKRELIPDVSVLIVKHHLSLERRAPWFRLAPEAVVIMSQYYTVEEIIQYFSLLEIKDYDVSEVIPLLKALKDHCDVYYIGVERFRYYSTSSITKGCNEIVFQLLLTDVPPEVEAEIFALEKEFFFIRMRNNVLKSGISFVFRQEKDFQSRFWKLFEESPGLFSLSVQKELLCECPEEQSICFLKTCDSSFPGQAFWSPEIEYVFSQCADRPQAQELYRAIFGEKGYFGNWNLCPQVEKTQEAEIVPAEEDILQPQEAKTKEKTSVCNGVASDTFLSNNVFSRMFRYIFS